MCSTGPGTTSLQKVAHRRGNQRIDSVRSVFFQCARPIKRSGLWNPAQHVAAGTLPSPGAVLQCLSQAATHGTACDAALQARQAATLY